MRQTGVHAHRGPRPPRFPPGVARIVRLRRWAAWAGLAALAAVILCGGTGPGYEFSDSRAHGIFVALVLAVWTAAVCLVAAGTSWLRRHGVYTAGFLDAPFRPVRRWADPHRRAFRRRRAVLPEWLVRAAFGVAVLVCLAVTLPDQVNAVASLTDSAPAAAMTSGRAVGYTVLGMIIDVAAAATVTGAVVRLRGRLGRRTRRGLLLPWLR